MGTALRGASRASGGVREGVPHEGVAPGGAGPVEAQDVEAAGGVAEAAEGQVEGGGAGEATLLGWTDAGDGGTEGGGGAGLDFDEAEDAAAVARDEVDLAGVIDDVALEDLVALGGQPGRGGLLGGAAAGVGAGAGCLAGGSHGFIAARGRLGASGARRHAARTCAGLPPLAPPAWRRPPGAARLAPPA